MLATRELFSRSCEPEFDVLDRPGLQASATGTFDDARPGVHRHFGKHADRVTEGTCPNEFRFRFRMHGPAPRCLSQFGVLISPSSEVSASSALTKLPVQA